MTIRLVKNTQGRGLLGLIIDKKTISEMVKAYRQKHAADPDAVKYIHFNMKEVIQLFIDNAIVDKDRPLNDQLGNLDVFGLKIYLANHTAASNCPPGQEAQYLHKDTVILCNTALNNATKTWEDQLKSSSAKTDENNAVVILGAGEGLDRGSMCPPNCPGNADSAGNDSQDIGSN